MYMYYGASIDSLRYGWSMVSSSTFLLSSQAVQIMPGVKDNSSISV